VPQNRERIIFIGLKRAALTPDAITALSSEKIPEEYDPYPIYTHKYTSEAKGDKLMPYVTVADCFVGLAEPAMSMDIDQKKYSKAHDLELSDIVLDIETKSTENNAEPFDLS
jgi:DNA (cytosine-5)-methyltransferase 1